VGWCRGWCKLEHFVIREQRPERSSPPAFQVLEHHLMPLIWEHADVHEPGVVAIARVMHDLASLEFPLEPDL
jgi:hypothetical protein